MDSASEQARMQICKHINFKQSQGKEYGKKISTYAGGRAGYLRRREGGQEYRQFFETETFPAALHGPVPEETQHLIRQIIENIPVRVVDQKKGNPGGRAGYLRRREGCQEYRRTPSAG